MRSDIPRLDLTIDQGKTFEKVIRWEKEPFLYVPIASITQAAPARINCQSVHGLVDGWRVAVRGAKGMRQINAQADPDKPPMSSDFHRATIVDSDTIDLNDLVSADWPAHTENTGFLQFYTPADLAGCTARMTVKNRIGGDELLSLTTENDGIALDDAAKTITLTVSADDSADITWTRGVYDLEIQDGDGKVTPLFQGTVTVTREVTT